MVAGSGARVGPGCHRPRRLIPAHHCAGTACGDARADRWKERAAGRIGPPPLTVENYLNLNFAVWLLPSAVITFSSRQVPAQAFNVDQT